MKQYGIMTTRYWYNNPDTREIECDGIGRPLIFDDHKDAAAWIDDADQTVYETSHNESGRPEYAVINVLCDWYRGELGRMRQYRPFAGSPE